MRALWLGGCVGLFGDIALQVALLVEMLLQEDAATLKDDAAEVHCDFEQLLLGRRLDQDLVDGLTMGQGADRHADERVANPRSHARSWRILQPRFKRPRQWNFGDQEDQILYRYWRVGQHFFSSVQHVSLSSDGSRAGSRDVMESIVCGTSSSGITRSMWGPTQATRM